MGRQGLLAAVLIMVSACGMGTTGNSNAIDTLDSELNLGDKERSIPDRDCRDFSVRPMATGTIRAEPANELVEVASGTSVQSMYFASTGNTAEVRNGVVEFQLPALGGYITKAELRFNDVHPYQLQAVPADLHQLSLHGQVDGAITVDDWAREGSPFALFATDLNDLNPPERVFDIRGTVALGGKLGLHLNLDRSTLPNGAYGSSFEGFRLDVTVCGESRLVDGAPSGDPIF